MSEYRKPQQNQVSWRVCRAQRPTFRFGPGAQLPWHHQQRKIRTGGSGSRVWFDFGFLGTNTPGEETAPYLCMVDHVSGAVFAVLTSKAVSDHVIQAMGASVAN